MVPPSLRLVLVGIFVLAARPGPPALASPLEDAIDSGVFTGPTHPHASAIYLNPAALGLAGQGEHFYLGGSLRLSQFDVNRRLLDPESGELMPGPSAYATTLSPGGLAAFYASVGERAHVGVALHTPFFERFIEDERALRYHTLGGQTYQALGSISFAYTASRKFIFGLGLSIGYSAFELELARDSALEAGSGEERGIASDCDGSPCGLENPAASQTYRVEVATDGIGGLFQTKNLGLSGGIAFMPWDDWWFGVSYVSPPGALLSLDLSGDVEVVEAPRDGGGTVRGDAEITYDMPQSLHAGVRGPIFPGHEIVGGVRWQNYSRHELLDMRFFGGDLEEATGEIPEWYPRYRGFGDVWRLTAGLERQQGPRFRYGGRVRLENGAVDEREVTPLQVEGMNLTLAAGAQIRIARGVVLTGGYDVTWYPELSARGSAFDPRDRLACIDSGFEFDACQAAREGRATPTPAGSYNRLKHAFTFSIRYDRL